MDTKLGKMYFNWLYDKVASTNEKDPAKSYVKLLSLMHRTEFVWFIPNDDNRFEDGRDFRAEFLESQNIHVEDDTWVDVGCSIFEMVLGLSKRLAIDESDMSDWFWHLMKNLKLGNLNDRRMMNRKYDDYVQEILEDLVWRHYQEDGQGGLFPLRFPKEDQRKVELWYQLSSYLLEGRGL